MRIALFTICLTLCLACGSDRKPDDQAFMESLDSLQQTTVPIDNELIGGILNQIPSPLEISVLLKKSGLKYNKSLLNSPGNLSRYNSNFKQALNLGIYGTDLGYTNIYEQNLDGIQYLSSIKSLADELNIGQFFDLKTIGRLSANSKNLDSLLLITTQNFNSINSHLQSQDRANLSVLLLIGGWVEAMKITCEAADERMSGGELHEIIGAQKIILEQIMLLLEFYKGDSNIAMLMDDFKELESAFNNIDITYTYKESTMEIVNGVAVIKDNSSTKITITDEDVAYIKNQTLAIRNKIIG